MLSGLRKEFRDHAVLMALAASAGEKYVFSRQDNKTALKTLKRATGKAAGSAQGASDLAASYLRQAGLLANQKDLDSIRTIYRRALSEHGSDPALFKALGKDFFGFLSKDAVLSIKACHDLESACGRQVGKGGGDWFDTTSQNSAWQLVANCYGSAGDNAKAERIEREMKQRKDSARRKTI